METFTRARDMVDDPQFSERRRASLEKLVITEIDRPLVRLVEMLTNVPCCFTLQSCYGHFVYGDIRDPQNLIAMPENDPRGPIEYRIAYLALCVQNSDAGQSLMQDLACVDRIDPEFICWGSADWFWERHVNSYVLQVVPPSALTHDHMNVEYTDAVRIESVKFALYKELETLISNSFF